MRPLFALVLILALAACDALPDASRPVTPIEQWQGATAPQSAPLQLLAETEEEWQSLWALAGSPVPRPLPSDAVGVGIFLGARPTGGYTLILRGERLPEGELLVEWREELPAKETMVMQMVTQPWAIALYPAGDGKILLRPAY